MDFWIFLEFKKKKKRNLYLDIEKAPLIVVNLVCLKTKKPSKKERLMQFDDNMISGRLQEEILKNRRKKKKEKRKRTWKQKKERNLLVAESFKRIGLKSRSEAMKHCSEFQLYSKCIEDDYKKLEVIHSCNDRFCCICNSKRADILQHQIKEMVIELEKEQEVEFVFLTLTVENVKGNFLSKSLDEILLAFNRFFKYKKLDEMSVGYIRSLEVTRNTEKGSESYGTYHPHFHVLLAVKPSYFTGKNYIKQEELTKLWKKALRAKYKPIVHIEKVKEKYGQQKLMSAILETAKYSVKDTDYICDTEEETDKVLRELTYALKGRRLLGFSKVFRQIRADLKMLNVEDKMDLDVEKEDKKKTCPVCGGPLIKELYAWDEVRNDYVKLNILPEKIEYYFSEDYYEKMIQHVVIKRKPGESLEKARKRKFFWFSFWGLIGSIQDIIKDFPIKPS